MRLSGSFTLELIRAHVNGLRWYQGIYFPERWTLAVRSKPTTAQQRPTTLTMLFNGITVLLRVLGLVGAHGVARDPASHYAARNLATVQAIYNNTVGSTFISQPSSGLHRAGVFITNMLHHRSTRTTLRSSSPKDSPFRACSQRRRQAASAPSETSQAS